MARIRRLVAKGAMDRKKTRFITAARGPHKRDSSIALLTIIRDMLGLAETGKEARKIIKSGLVKTDGKIMKDPKRGMGIFDTIEVGGKSYRIVPRKRLELAASQAGSKIVQIIGKTAVKGGKIQVNLNDGKNMLTDKQYKVLDSLLISLPDQKVKEHIAFEPGVTVLITKGLHSGKLARLIDVDRKNKRVWLEEHGKKFECPLQGTIAVGREKPLIELGA